MMRNLFLFWILSISCANAHLEFPLIPQNFSANGLGPECASALFKFMLSFPEEEWALKMVDASGKIPAGIQSGNLNNIGDRHACVHITGPRLKGRYIRVATGVKQFGFTQGLCLPDVCTPEDVKTLLSSKGLTATLVEDDYLDRRIELDGSDIAFIFLISIPLLLVLIGTSLEIVEGVFDLKKDREVFRVLRFFSLITNTKELFAIPKPEAQDKVGKRLESLDGIRFISITWVLVCHNLQSYDSKADNIMEAFEIIFSGFWSQTISNGFSSVDTFFLLSGVLVSYLTTKELERNSGRLNWFLFYFHRYVRITVVYAMIIFFVSTLFRYVGPSSFKILQESEKCRETFWANLLFIGNLVNPSHLCVGPSWYLDCDMQMFLISPLVIYPLWRKQTVGLAIATGLIMGSTGIIAGKHFEYRDSWASTSIGSDGDLFFEENYVMPWMRIQPYLVGLVLGYILFRSQGKTSIPRLGMIAGWIIAFAIGFSTIYGLDMDKFFNGISPLAQPIAERMAYGSLSRLSWALAVSWVIFACETGNGGPIHRLLSWEFFKPLSKLTFMVYLMHMTVLFFLRDRISFAERFTVISITVGTMFVLNLSLIVSYIIHVILEVPSGKLEKYLVSKFIRK